MTANEAKTQFGELIMTTQQGPVSITKNGKQAMVTIEPQRFAELEQAEADLFWLKLFPTEERQKKLSAFIDKNEAAVEAGNYVPFNGSLEESMAAYRAKRK